MKQACGFSKQFLSALRKELKVTRDANFYKRAFALLEIASGESISNVATKMQVQRSTIYNWIDLASTGDVMRLYNSKKSGRPSLWTVDLDTLLYEALINHPWDYGYMAVEWTVSLLQQHLARFADTLLSPNSIRERIHFLGFVWKRPRYALKPDPCYSQKKLKSSKN